MADTNQTQWVPRFWLFGTVLFSAVVLYGLFRGTVELYQVAALLLFAGMTASTFRKKRRTGQQRDPDAS